MNLCKEASEARSADAGGPVKTKSERVVEDIAVADAIDVMTMKVVTIATAKIEVMSIERMSCDAANDCDHRADVRDDAHDGGDDDHAYDRPDLVQDCHQEARDDDQDREVDWSHVHVVDAQG